MDIQEIRGSDSELSHVPLESTISCPGCAAEVISGDRFCQECGTRVSINRARKASSRDKKSAIHADGTASVICFNCGTSNPTLSKVCGDCRNPLVTETVATSGALQGGLRGSIANKSKLPAPTKTVRSKPESRQSASLSRASDASASRLPSQAAANPSPSKTAAVLLSSQPAGNPLPAQTASASTVKGGQPGATHRSATEQNVFAEDKSYDSVFKQATEPNHEALDYLFSPDSRNRAPLFGSFDKLISDSRNIRNVFSLSTVLMTVESFVERIPTPLVFLVLSLVTVIATVNATTQWNRHEQRLQALDKIAANAEENMRRYELDIAIRTLRELDRTEKGDLPPRARAVLNQSLWLRSYKLAKEQQYARALKDLSRVTPEFVSYDDVKEKKEAIGQLLASHPEFASGGNSASGKDVRKIAASRTAPTLRATSEPRRARADDAPSSDLGAPVPPKSESKSSTRNDRERLTETSQDVISLEFEPAIAKATEQILKSANSQTSELRKREKNAGEVKSKKLPKGNLPDRDMKRYSDLLVDYFSREESGRGEGEQVAEPPSFEEWVRNGKGDL
ncbi:MAG: zinc ribbon domain-containing protein [Candidatus Obscuribacterales bacterium]|nr:zinc ribbon domain-containing protein [Candidatus Obscuribacterales bacterium]